MKELVCIVCPRSCRMQVGRNADGGIAVTGNTCKRGYDFAVNELTDPKRTLCTTVRTSFAHTPVLPVRLSGEIPKARVFDVMREIGKTTVSSPVARGEAVITDVLGLGVDVISTSDILKENEKAGDTL